MEGGWSWCVRKKRPVAYSEVGEKGAYKQCLMTTFFCKKETPCLLVCFVHTQPDELTKIKPGKDLGLFPGARSGGWLRETGRSAGKSKALQCQVALPSWCCCRSPHRCRAELCSPGLGSLPLASFFALCACYLLVTMWLLQF